MNVAPTNPSTPAPPTELETQVANRKRALISEIVEHRKDTSLVGATEAIDRAKARLTELAHIVKEGVVDGWANVGPSAKLKLDEWMAK